MRRGGRPARGPSFTVDPTARRPQQPHRPTTCPRRRRPRRWLAPRPVIGNSNGRASVPAEAAVDTPDSGPGHRHRPPASCTSEAVVPAVAAGGISTFNCGPAPVTIVMRRLTAKVHNNVGRTVLDGGGQVTLSGGGSRRILYMNTCDRTLGPSKSDCLYQTDTQLVVQNLTFVDGNSTGDRTEGGGGGAILVRGGRLMVINSGVPA